MTAAKVPEMRVVLNYSQMKDAHRASVENTELTLDLPPQFHLYMKNHR